MNILDKIKKKWNHKESVEQNVLRFNNEQEQRQRRIKKLYPLFIFLFILVCLVFPISPLVGLCLMIGTISFGSEYIFNSATTTYTSIIQLDSTHFVVVYQDNGDSNKGIAVVGVISSGTTITYGSEYTFASGTTSCVSGAKIDSTHFVVSYLNYDDDKGYCIIGTISGNTISYGSAYSFGSMSGDKTSTSLLDSTHFVVSYWSSTSYGYGANIIGTISSTTNISFGSEYIYNSAITEHGKVEALDSTHFVQVYQDNGDSNKGKAIIGVVSSGTVITYGSEYTFNSSFILSNSVAKIDSTHFVVAYQDNTNSDYGTCIIGTVSSGNQVSFGSKYVFVSSGTYNVSVHLIDSTRFVVAYLNDTKGKAIIGTIASVNQITYGSEYTFNSANTNYISTALVDSTHISIAYQDTGNSSYGTAIIGTITSVPIVTTQSADQIATTSVRGNGNITATGGANATRRGFCYKAGTSGDPTVADSVAYDDGSFGTGAYTKSIIGLTAGTNYRVRAYAVNSAGTSYGSTVNVKTLSAFIPRTTWI